MSEALNYDLLLLWWRMKHIYELLVLLVLNFFELYILQAHTKFAINISWEWFEKNKRSKYWIKELQS
jgi:hypothetical protein